MLPTVASLGDVVYGITYDDGDEEQAVPRSRIRLVGKGGGGAPAKPKPSGPPDFFKRSVTASLTWGITKERRGNVVKATLWTSADDANSVEFKKQFAAVAHGLGKNLELDVRYFLRSGRATGCQPMGRFNCRGQCTNNGLYCSPDPDNDAFFGLDGEDIVRENMRQMCVLNVSRAEGHPEKWWDYVNAANDACGNFKILPDAQKCRHVAVVEAIMAKVGLDPKKVAQCIAEAGGTDDDGGTNHALEAELRAQTDANVFLQPTLLINGRQYRGNFLCPNPNSLSHCAVLEALCAGFDAAHTNGLCVEEKQPTYEMRYLSKGAGASWRDAELQCVTAGGHLAHLRDGQANERALKKCRSQRCWIGLNDRSAEGVFVWTDGTPLDKKKEGGFWAPGEPNNGGVAVLQDSAKNPGEDCVYMHGTGYGNKQVQGKWGDHACTNQMGAVCQVPMLFKFSFFSEPKSWADAEAACAALGAGAHLADVHSIKEDRNVFAQCRAERCWIGLNDRQVEGFFRWTDGVQVGTRKYFKRAFTNWAPGEPNNGGVANGAAGDEDCVYIHGATYATPQRRDKWGDHVCSQKMPYVCQVRDTYSHSVRDRSAYAPLRGEDVSFKVISPPKLAQRFPDGMQVRPSLFGVPPYGGAVSGALIYAPLGNRALCGPLNKKLAAGKRGWPKGGYVVLLASRGSCAFTRKVRMAQRAGAHALVIINNDDDTDGSAQNLPYMQTDQDTSDIYTPSVMVHSADGKLLLQELCGKGQVVVDEDKCSDEAGSDFTAGNAQVRLGWGMATKKKVVDWIFWTSCDDPFSARIKREFEPVAKALGASAVLRVRYQITSGRDIGCFPSPRVLSPKCDARCTNGGRYCASDWPVASRYVVEENLRQMCVYRVASVAGEHHMWWEYVNKFAVECKMGGYSMRSLQMEPGACAKDVSKIYKLMAEVGLDPQAVKDCVSNSGGTKADKANTLLEQQISQQIDEDAFMKPTVIVNGARYRGNLDCSNPTKSTTTCGLLVAICSGFAAGSAPSICQASSAAAKRAAAAIEKGNTVTTLTPPLDARGQPTAHKWTVGTLATPAAKHDVVLQLASPQKLVDHFAKSFIECRPSLFGIPAYGGSVSGSLVYGSPANRNGCKPFATATWPKGARSS